MKTIYKIVTSQQAIEKLKELGIHWEKSFIPTVEKKHWSSGTTYREPVNAVLEYFMVGNTEVAYLNFACQCISIHDGPRQWDEKLIPFYHVDHTNSISA